MRKSKQLFSEITSQGQLNFSLGQVDVPEPKENEVVVRIEAAPINPSDMWPMFGPANLAEASLEYGDTQALLRAPVHAPLLARVQSRLDQKLPVGNEGAGTVVAAGSADVAQSMMGKVVAVLNGACYSEYVCVPITSCLVHNEGTTPRQAASSFVNPLTALAMVETMRDEGHTAIVHTAAASNLGQILNQICLQDDVPLINVVRSQEQIDILKERGAKIVCNSSQESFDEDLYQAIAQTNATIGFDATGGGELVSKILTAMERFGSKDIQGLNTYGSLHHKQVYVYGSLDFSPTVLNRAYGMFWGIGGWLLMPFLMKAGPEKVAQMHKRVADEINSTFKAHFEHELNFEQAMTPEVIYKYNAKKTGQKVILNPTLSA